MKKIDIITLVQRFGYDFVSAGEMADDILDIMDKEAVGSSRTFYLNGGHVTLRKILPAHEILA